MRANFICDGLRVEADVVDVNTGKWMVIDAENDLNSRVSRPTFAIFLGFLPNKPLGEDLLVKQHLPKDLLMADRSRFRISTPAPDVASKVMKSDEARVACLRGIQIEMWHHLDEKQLALPFCVSMKLPAVRQFPPGFFPPSFSR